MGVATRSLFVFDNSFVRELEGLYEPWQAAPAPAPRLLALNEALAAELGLDAEALRSPDGVAVLVGNATPRRRDAGGAGLRRPPVRRLLAPPRRRPRAPARRGARRPRPPSRPAPEGLGPHAVRPRRRRQGRRRPDAARVRDRRGDARARHPDDPGARRRRDRRARRARDRRCRARCSTRVAASHLRVGTFQYAASAADPTLVRRLADYAIARHHPHAAEAENPYLAFFESVVDAQASLVARWMLVGFIHGVMNTDNMTISGETIDYGPCAFMDAYDPATVFSSIDHGGRYAYGNQPHDRAVEPGAAGRDAAAADRRRRPTRRSRRPPPCWRPFPDRYERLLEPRHARQARPRRRPARATPSSSTTCSRCCRHSGSTSRSCFRALSSCVRGDRCAGAGALRRPRRLRRLGGRAGARGCVRRDRTPSPPRWTASTRSTSRATTWSRRR